MVEPVTMGIAGALLLLLASGGTFGTPHRFPPVGRGIATNLSRLPRGAAPGVAETIAGRCARRGSRHRLPRWCSTRCAIHTSAPWCMRSTSWKGLNLQRRLRAAGLKRWDIPTRWCARMCCGGLKGARRRQAGGGMPAGRRREPPVRAAAAARTLCALLRLSRRRRRAATAWK